MEIRCFNCGVEMVESRFTPVGELPEKEKYPTSLYIHHPKTNHCPVADYVIQIGYRTI